MSSGSYFNLDCSERAPAGDAVARTRELVSTAVKRQMVSDVPLGAFLSGGIDSSTVVALMQAQSNRRVHTFSIGSRDERYDEATNARKAARTKRAKPDRLVVGGRNREVQSGAFPVHTPLLLLAETRNR